MEEAQGILLNSLEQFGVSLPAGVSSIREMAPSALISICSQSLNLIDSSVSFPTSLPDSTAERIDICTKITSSIKALGYRGDLSFHQVFVLYSFFLRLRTLGRRQPSESRKAFEWANSEWNETKRT